MTKKNKNAWHERLRLWMEDDINPLDEELEHSLKQNRATPNRFLASDAYAQRDQERDHWQRMVMEEKQHLFRLDAWAQTQGIHWLNWVYRILAMVICSGIILFLINTILQLPPFGAADNPYHNEVSLRYLEKGTEETGAVNLVTGMILDYRAFDTFGESTVLFAAACGVLFLLKLGDHTNDSPTPAMLEAEFDDRNHEPKNDIILQLAAKILTPLILLFGLYVVLNGHISPGGGFSGGAVMGAGLILYLNAFGFKKTERFFTYTTFRWVTFLSLMTYAGLKSYSFYMGANQLSTGIPLGTPGNIFSAGFILPLNICVGLIVMCTMYTFYTLFRKGGI